eukprot:663188-Rhodomonas_salina.1
MSEGPANEREDSCVLPVLAAETSHARKITRHLLQGCCTISGCGTGRDQGVRRQGEGGAGGRRG